MSRSRLIDGVQPMIEIDESAIRPEPMTQFFARDELTGPLQQQRQHLESLFLEGDPYAGFPQLARPAIQFKDAKPDKARRQGHLWHASSSAQRMLEIGAILHARPSSRLSAAARHPPEFTLNWGQNWGQLRQRFADLDGYGVRERHFDAHAADDIGRRAVEVLAPSFSNVRPLFLDDVLRPGSRRRRQFLLVGLALPSPVAPAAKRSDHREPGAEQQNRRGFRNWLLEREIPGLAYARRTDARRDARRRERKDVSCLRRGRFPRRTVDRAVSGIHGKAAEMHEVPAREQPDRRGADRDASKRVDRVKETAGLRA